MMAAVRDIDITMSANTLFPVCIPLLTPMCIEFEFMSSLRGAARVETARVGGGGGRGGVDVGVMDG
jgi:hypothetical protein